MSFSFSFLILLPLTLSVGCLVACWNQNYIILPCVDAKREEACFSSAPQLPAEELCPHNLLWHWCCHKLNKFLVLSSTAHGELSNDMTRYKESINSKLPSFMHMCSCCSALYRKKHWEENISNCSRKPSAAILILLTLGLFQQNLHCLLLIFSSRREAYFPLLLQCSAIAGKDVLLWEVIHT